MKVIGWVLTTKNRGPALPRDNKKWNPKLDPTVAPVRALPGATVEGAKDDPKGTKNDSKKCCRRRC